MSCPITPQYSFKRVIKFFRKIQTLEFTPQQLRAMLQIKNRNQSGGMVSSMVCYGLITPRAPMMRVTKIGQGVQRGNTTAILQACFNPELFAWLRLQPCNIPGREHFHVYNCLVKHKWTFHKARQATGAFAGTIRWLELAGIESHPSILAQIPLVDDLDHPQN